MAGLGLMGAARFRVECVQGLQGCRSSAFSARPIAQARAQGCQALAPLVLGLLLLYAINPKRSVSA
jgi:hypothetical protein